MHIAKQLRVSGKQVRQESLTASTSLLYFKSLFDDDVPVAMDLLNLTSGKVHTTEDKNATNK